MIDAQKFREATGRAPKNDDLDRCNCKDAGRFGHMWCGWCPKCDKPCFECGHMHSTQKGMATQDHRLHDIEVTDIQL